MLMIAYVLRFLRVLRSGRKKKKKKQKNSVVFFSISLECLNNALFGKEIARGLELGLFANARHGCLSVRSLESWNRCTCTSGMASISYWSAVFSSVA